MLSRRSAVCSSPLESQEAMSPAPTTTGSPGGGGGGAAVTVIVLVPCAVSTAAVIVAVPAFTPVTMPDEDTLATVLSELDHVAVWPVTTALFLSRAIAVSCVVAPTATLDEGGVMVTLVASSVLTGATMTVAIAATLSSDTLIFAVPLPAAVMTPVSSTV